MRQVSTRYFNSRPLTRSTHNDFLHLIESDISTHDLLRGRLLSLSVRGRSMLFQLTTSYEVDLSFSPSLLILLYFNSRPLTRSTLTLQHRTAGLCISTHDLLRGRLRSLERSYQSLHHFNSRPLTRSTIGLVFMWWGVRISTHDLLRGRLKTYGPMGCMSTFQLTTSYEVDSPSSPISSMYCIFQLTTSYEVDWQFCIIFSYLYVIHWIY